MDAFALILALLMLLVGAVAGAAAPCVSSAAVWRWSRTSTTSRPALRGQRPASRRPTPSGGCSPRRTGSSATQDDRTAACCARWPRWRRSSRRSSSRSRLLERDRLEQYGQLAEQLQEAQRCRRAAAALHADARIGVAAPTAPADSGARSQLRRVVEAAGMLRHVDFHEQVTAGRRGRTGRPDLVVQLPGGQAARGGREGAAGAYLAGPGDSRPPAPRCRAAATAAGAAGGPRQGRCTAHVDALSSQEVLGASPATPRSWWSASCRRSRSWPPPSRRIRPCWTTPVQERGAGLPRDPAGRPEIGGVHLAAGRADGQRPGDSSNSPGSSTSGWERWART